MPTSPEVTVLIVNYRSYDDLSGCLAAVLSCGNSVQPEVVVVDQESDGGSASKIRAQFPDITIIPNPHNDGFAAGVNRGASRATGRHLLLLNPDTLIGPGLVQALAARLNEHYDVAVVGPRILNADGTLQLSARRFPDLTTGLGGRMSWLTRNAPDNWLSRRNLAWSWASEPVNVDWVSGACMMIQRSAFDVGRYGRTLFLVLEDADLCQRPQGTATVYLPSVSVVHERSRAPRTGGSGRVVESAPVQAGAGKTRRSLSCRRDSVDSCGQNVNGPRDVRLIRGSSERPQVDTAARLGDGDPGLTLRSRNRSLRRSHFRS